MVKWADYLVSAVRYNAKHTHIEMVRVHKDSDNAVANVEEITRSTMIANIKNGVSYVTVFGGSGSPTKGQDVRIIPVGNQEFIRTDANAKEADNLENLPEF